MQIRNTNRKNIISSILSSQDKPVLLSELRAQVHRQETEPKKFKDFTISDAYSHSFNRTVRSMFPIVRTYRTTPTIDTLFAGIVARVLLLQCVKKGLYRKLPVSGVLPKIVLFGEIAEPTHPLGPSVKMRWISGVVLSSKGKVRHISSSPASFQPTFVHSRPPTWGELRALAKVPWKIELITIDGCKEIPPTALLQPIGVLYDALTPTFTVGNEAMIDRTKTRPPREIVLPKLNETILRSFNRKRKFYFRTPGVGYQAHSFDLSDTVPISK